MYVHTCFPAMGDVLLLQYATCIKYEGKLTTDHNANGCFFCFQNEFESNIYLATLNILQ